MDLFIRSLQVMGVGMLGIFIVALLLMLVMKALTSLFPATEEDKEQADTN